MSGLWEGCREQLAPGLLRGELVRAVESQEQVATRHLVDNLHEQAALERLLDRAKPRRRPGTERLHYLLATPFRYPPLRHGSRFGTAFEPGLFYGAQQERTALAETAYYRCVFWQGMQTPPTARLTTQHTLFGARYQTERGVALHRPPCSAFRTQLTDPVDYTATQALGHALREAGVLAIEYESARDPESGINVALFHPVALRSRKPTWQSPWLCDTDADGVVFYGAHRDAVYHFPLATFLVDGVLPQPAV